MKKIILFLLVILSSNTIFAQLNITSRSTQPKKVMSVRPTYSQLWYQIEESDTLYFFSINTDNQFDDPIYFAIGYRKNSAIQSVEDLIEIAEKGNKNNETISVPGMYTDDRIYISSGAIFGIKGLILTQRGHAGVSNLNLGELRRVSEKLKSQE